MSHEFSIPLNLADDFFANAKAHPDKVALIEPKTGGEERVWTYGEFASLVQGFRRGLDHHHLQPGDRFLVIMPVSVSFYAFLAALFSNGIVPVFIDTTLSPTQLIHSIRLSKAKALISTETLLRHRFYLPALWNKKLFSTDGSGLFLKNWQDLIHNSNDRETADLLRPTVSISPGDTSLISFTTGTTGRPKGADRQHQIIAHQRFFSHRSWPKNDSEVDLCGFPLVVLMNLNWGITTVLPDMDLRYPSQACPQKLVQQLNRWQVTRMSASPAVFNNLTNNQITPDCIPKSFQSSVTGGAAVPQWLACRIQNLFQQSENYIVYGSTEAEPISGINIKEFLGEKDHGYLVGKPIEGIKIKLFSPEDKLLETPLPQGQTGEILLSGPHVIKNYIANPEATRQTKPKDLQGKTWHRTGDLGFFDQRDRLWLVGRIKDQINIDGTLHPTFPFEHQVENQSPPTRVALIMHPQTNTPLLTIENPSTNSPNSKNLNLNLNPNNLPFNLPNLQIQELPHLPLDPRHNWRINRKALTHHLTKK